MKIVQLRGEHAGRFGQIEDGNGEPRVSIFAPGTSLEDIALGRAHRTGIHIRLDEALLAVPLVPGARVICIGLNFASHASEARIPVPPRPSLFSRFASSFADPGEPITLPAVSSHFDFEGELAVVIGAGGRRIPENEAEHHVFGYTCLADNSLRDWQTHSRQVLPGKNFDNSGSIGPWIVTKDDMPDLDDVQIETFVNGVRRQHGVCNDLIFSVPYCISYISQFMALRAGDVISMGTPGGVAFGEETPNWLKAGDELDIRISGIGSLRSVVIADI